MEDDLLLEMHAINTEALKENNTECQGENASNEHSLSDENDEMLILEFDKRMRLLKVDKKRRELSEKNSKKVEENRMSLKNAGNKKREWIIENENTEKIRMVQAIMDGLVKAGVSASVENFNMKEMRNEIVRVGRIEKATTMRMEWEKRMRLEGERKLEREMRFKKIRRIECEKIGYELL